MAQESDLRLAMLGMVDGNGHPYSWSAMFNGYDPEVMADCPYAGIPEYLDKEPKEIRLSALSSNSNAPVGGVYSVEDDTLVICLGLEPKALSLGTHFVDTSDLVERLAAQPVAAEAAQES